MSEPLQYAGAYDLHLYCDQKLGFPHDQDSRDEFVGETFSECVKLAKAKGWKIHHKTRTATCPDCAKIKRPTT